MIGDCVFSTILGDSKSEKTFKLIIKLKVKAILLLWWILLIGGYALGRVCTSVGQISNFWTNEYPNISADKSAVAR